MPSLGPKECHFFPRGVEIRLSATPERAETSVLHESADSILPFPRPDDQPRPADHDRFDVRRRDSFAEGLLHSRVFGYGDLASFKLQATAMRSALGKELRKQFGKAITGAFPGFVEIKGRSVWPGDRVYAQRASQASCFIRLVPCDNADKFRVMYGWSSSDGPLKARWSPASEPGECLAGDDGFEFRITVAFNDVGGRMDRWWVLEDAMEAALDHALKEFAEPGDSQRETLERVATKGVGFTLRNYRETPVEELLPNLPGLIDDCLHCIQETVIPYFERVKELPAR